MDNDQFGGRTDDDLFSDDFEPVVPQELASAAAPVQPDVPAVQDQSTSAGEVRPPPSTSSSTSLSTAPTKTLAHSRHNRPQRPPTNKPKTEPAPTTNVTTAVSSTSPSASPGVAPKGPSRDKDGDSAGNAAPPAPPTKSAASAVSAARLGSGANPRTKLTDEELSARMEKMRLLAAEKTRRFEQAQRDATEHDEAVAKGREEAAKRRAAEAVRRRVAEEERRRLEEERAKNRERKLQAMGMKEGGWDAGKEERMQEEERGGRFRGAYGGVRGSRGGGLAGSRYADGADSVVGDDGGPGSTGGRGRSNRGGRGASRGRGGRGGSHRTLFDAQGDRVRDPQDFDRPGPASRPQAAAPKEKPSLTAEDFPALGPAKKLDTNISPNLPPPDIPLSPPIGKWADEVAAMDEKMGEQGSGPTAWSTQ